MGQHVNRCGDCQIMLQSVESDAPSWHDLATANQVEGSGYLADKIAALKREVGTPTADAGTNFVGDLEPWLKTDPAKQTQPQIDEFILQQCIGRGGMGAVFLANDTKLARQVALKIMTPGLLADPTAAERFQREARSAAAINHPNVVTIHAVGVHRDLPYLVMELVDGQSLEDRLRIGALPASTWMPIAQQIAEGLSAAHVAGVQHRDVKPANILLQTGTDGVKLTDFGLAKTRDSQTLTRTGFLVGTPKFIAPEQFDPTIGPVDHRSDLFSFGSVLYWMITGQAPFRDDSVLGTLRRVREQPHRPISSMSVDCPEHLAHLVDRLLEKHPARRPQSAADVVRAIAERQPVTELLPAMDLQIETGPPRRSQAVRQGQRRRTTPLGGTMAWAVLLVATILVAVGVFVVTRWGDSRPRVQAFRAESAGMEARIPNRRRSQVDQDADRNGDDGTYDITNTDELIELLDQTADDIRIRVLADELELPTFSLDGRDMHLTAPPELDTRLVFQREDVDERIQVRDASLHLENVMLEFVGPMEPEVDDIDAFVAVVDGEFLAENCSIEMESSATCFLFEGADAELIHCDLHAMDAAAIRWEPQPGSVLRIVNCVMASAIQLVLGEASGDSIVLEHNTFIGEVNFECLDPGSETLHRLTANQNVFAATESMMVCDRGTSSASWLRWTGRANQLPLAILAVQEEEDEDLIEVLTSIESEDPPTWFDDRTSRQEPRLDGRSVETIWEQLDSGEIRPQQLRRSQGDAGDEGEMLIGAIDHFGGG